MSKVIILLVMVFSFSACQDYIANKRDGLKRYPDHERQAQEEPDKEQ